MFNVVDTDSSDEQDDVMDGMMVDDLDVSA